MRTRSSFRKRLLASTAIAVGMATSTAWAAGYDTPILYSARHMGMGGTAIGYVDDPSAIFHNPAGIAAQQAGALHLNFSPIMGTLQGSPSDKSGNVQSNFALSPAFLGGFAWRVHRFLSAGVAIYPAASSGGGYSYTSKDGSGKTVSTEDKARLVFLEAAPTIAAELLPGLRLGVAARMAQVSFQRSLVNTTEGKDIPYIDMDMKGYAFTGFRVGLQYSASDFDIGAVYRTGSTAIVTADKAVVTGIEATDGSFSFILPSKVGVGVQYRGIANLRLAADFEYIFNSENQETEVKGTAFGQAVTVPNYSRWQDSMTIRVGGAYRMGRLEPRLGYILDTQAANPSFPSAFGSPPAPTHAVTAGCGYEISPNLDISVAGAYRSGGTEVTAANLKAADKACAFCGQAGTYAMELFGAYIDLRWRFGQPAAAPLPPAAPEAAPEHAPSPAGPEPAPESAPPPAAPAPSPAAPAPSPAQPAPPIAVLN
jgi:long-subunit fatty acid transport protein